MSHPPILATPRPPPVVRTFVIDFFFNLLISLKIDTILRFSLMHIMKKIYAWRTDHETCLGVADSAYAEWGYLKHLGSLQDSLFGQLEVSPKLPYFFIVVSEVRGTTHQSKLCMKWMNEWHFGSLIFLKIILLYIIYILKTLHEENVHNKCLMGLKVWWSWGSRKKNQNHSR